MVNIDFLSEANALKDELIERRRDLHMHPETAFEEFRTAGIVAEELNKLGLEVQTGVGKTGVVGILEGSKDGPTVLMRADMDALPIHELNEVAYTSTTPGKMHACGHDGHTTIALGVAKVLSKYRDQIAGRVKFVFQPAEEVAGGAVAMIKDGVLDDPRPDVSMGLHLWNIMPLGKLGVPDGPMMAGSSTFTIRLTGKGGHGAQPHQTIDPVVCAAQLVTALQTVVARNVDPSKTAVLSVTQIHAGDTHNVIPQTAYLNGTIRAFDVDVRDQVTKRLYDITEGICTAMECEFEVDVTHLTIPVVNNPDVSQRLRNRFVDIVGEDNLDLTASTMGGEDMAFLMNDIPGMFFFLGSKNDELGLNYSHHHPRFDFDENALPLGVALLASAVGVYVLNDDDTV